MAKLTTVRLEEINKAYWANLSHIEVRELLFHIFEREKEFSAALREAVASEREECANIAHGRMPISNDRQFVSDYHRGAWNACESIESCIRARAEQEGRG